MSGRTGRTDGRNGTDGTDGCSDLTSVCVELLKRQRLPAGDKASMNTERGWRWYFFRVLFSFGAEFHCTSFVAGGGEGEIRRGGWWLSMNM